MEMRKQNREYKKLEMNKTYQVEFLFDSPIPTEKQMDFGMIFGYKFAFRDLETNEEFQTIIGRNTKAAEKLLTYKRGDQIDITYTTFEMNGQQMKNYVINPVGTTPQGENRIFFDPSANQIPVSPKQHEMPVNVEIDIKEISW
jgi:hypothetical protein